MRIHKSLVMLSIVFFLSVVSAVDSSFIFQTSEELNLKIPVIDENNLPADDTTACQISINRPDDTALINDANMSFFGGGYFNITLNTSQTSMNGEHAVTMCCQNGANGCSTFPIEFTPNGERPNPAKSYLYLGLFIALVFFLALAIYGVVTVENLWGRFSLFWVAWLFLIAVTFVAWNLSQDFLTGAPFIASMFRIVFWVVMGASFPLVLVSIAWVVYTHTVTKEMRNMMEKGMSPEEAYERSTRRRSY